MKNEYLHIKSRWSQCRIIFISVTIIALIITNNSAIGQEPKDTASKLSFTMNINAIASNGTRSLKVIVTRKENKKTIMVDDLNTPLDLYLKEIKDYDAVTGTGWMSKTLLNNEGEGIFIFPSWFRGLADSVHEYTFIVKMNADPKYQDAEEQISIADAIVKLEYSGEDSVKSLAASISGWKDQAYIPVANAELKLCIKRTFNFLPIGEAGVATDSLGEISGEIPLDVPGNANRTITLAARLEDDDTYGTVEVTKDVPWAILPKANPIRGRTLWSPGDNAPLLLVISSVIIIVIIWGTIFYLVSLLFKIKRLGKT